jgi:dihydroorotase
VSDFVFRHALVVAGDTVLPDHDVAVASGRVTAIGRGLEAGGVEIDCSGAWLGPGFVDIHVHFREPGQEHKEDIASGSAAAAAGGFTAVVAMPNTTPALDSAQTVAQVAARGREVGLVEVGVAGCLSLGRSGRELAPLEELWDAGVRVFSDDGDTLADAGLMRRAMDFLAARGGVLSQHCVDPDLSRDGQMHEGGVSERLGLVGNPAAAEEIIIARDLLLVRLTGARYHVQHLSTAGAVDLIARAKTDGLPVTAEATPHHLMFDHRSVETGDTRFKMMPPLRTPDDVAALRRGLEDRVIDIVATDHAPHSDAEKALPWEDAPNGVTGLEWAAAVVNTVTTMRPESFFDAMATAPARIAGLSDHGRLDVGRPANLVVFDPAAATNTSITRSKSSNAPYLGLDLTGRVELTMYRGRVTYRSDAVPVGEGTLP